jgi:tRNA(Ile)-lysidine synthase
MINVQGKLPKKLIVACSGGPDSMAIVDFLKRKHDVALQFVHHQTDTSSEACELLAKYSKDNNIDIFVDYIDSNVPKGISQEEHWRNERYISFHKHNIPVITGHHLDDCVETWIWSSMHGMGKIIPYCNKNVIRPFRTNRKQDFVNWCDRNNVPYMFDKSNDDQKYMRNYIRHTVVPNVLHINPGIYKTIKKKIINDDIC